MAATKDTGEVDRQNITDLFSRNSRFRKSTKVTGKIAMKNKIYTKRADESNQPDTQTLHWFMLWTLSLVHTVAVIA